VTVAVATGVALAAAAGVAVTVAVPAVTVVPVVVATAVVMVPPVMMTTLVVVVVMMVMVVSVLAGSAARTTGPPARAAAVAAPRALGHAALRPGTGAGGMRDREDDENRFAALGSRRLHGAHQAGMHSERRRPRPRRSLRAAGSAGSSPSAPAARPGWKRCPGNEQQREHHEQRDRGRDREPVTGARQSRLSVWERILREPALVAGTAAPRDRLALHASPNVVALWAATSLPRRRRRLNAMNGGCSSGSNAGPGPRLGSPTSPPGPALWGSAGYPRGATRRTYRPVGYAAWHPRPTPRSRGGA
jgi:hypothetical protein